MFSLSYVSPPPGVFSASYQSPPRPKGAWEKEGVLLATIRQRMEAESRSQQEACNSDFRQLPSTDQKCLRKYIHYRNKGGEVPFASWIKNGRQF